MKTLYRNLRVRSKPKGTLKIFLLISRAKIGLLTVAAYLIGGGDFYSAEPATFASPYLNVVDAPHQVRILDDDTSALENVLEMIVRARKSIEMEYFVFNPDRAGRAAASASNANRVTR